MHSLGEKLRSRRLEKGLTLQGVAQDTLISKDYLDALEKENFSLFPSEAYIVGFLRIYAAHLGLDVDKIIIHYRHTVLQNQPAPVAELLRQPRKHRRYLWVLAALVLVVAALVLVFRFDLLRPVLTRSASVRPADTPAVKESQQLILLDTEFVEGSFEVGTHLEIPLGAERHVLTLASVTDNRVRITTAGAFFVIGNKAQQRVDINADDEDDLTISVRSIEDQQVVMRISRALDKPEVVPSANPALQEDPSTLLPDFLSVPVRISFVDTCYFRIRYQDTTIERLAQSGDSYEWDLTSPLLLWTTNAAAVRLSIDAEQSVLGESGEVFAGALSMLQDSSEMQWVLFE